MNRFLSRRRQRKPKPALYSLVELSERADANRRYWRMILVLLLLSSCFNGWGTYYTRSSGIENDDRISALVAELEQLVETNAQERASTIVDACAYRQRNREIAINTAGNQARRFADKVNPPATRSASTQAEVEAFVEEQRQAAADANPLADCSSEGIRQYYENAPPIVPCPAGGDGKGFCK